MILTLSNLHQLLFSGLAFGISWWMLHWCFRKAVYCVVIKAGALQMLVKSSWLTLFLEYSAYCLDCWLVDLATFKSEILKFTTIIAELWVSLFNSITFCFISIVCNCYILLLNGLCCDHKTSLFVSSSDVCLILSDINMVTPAYFWLLFSWYVFLYTIYEYLWI